ncbi:MAG: OmpA family protein [Rhodobacteraceae bacterium]|nr:OmpA family protein [Paracoccaceae bacterium]MBR9820269.1 OmpA family protein [Paracoccaceae bacterium]
MVVVVETARNARFRALALVAVAMVLMLAALPGAAQAQGKGWNEPYIPTIWVDPDGCEHWVMDDGAEGYMTPHLTRQGLPVCRRGNVCGVMQSDQFFATDSYAISAANKQRLADFFRQTGASAYVIIGHTDSRASDAYNMTLSYNRAKSVAGVAQSVGARISDVRGYGERYPAQPNNTTAGMAANRRVEIICIR